MQVKNGAIGKDQALRAPESLVAVGRQPCIIGECDCPKSQVLPLDKRLELLYNSLIN